MHLEWSSCNPAFLALSVVVLDADLQDRVRLGKIDLPDPRDSPEEEAVYAELDKALQSELGRLPEAQRQVLLMRNVNDMSYEDIAAALKCQIGTVKSRLARAREELRRRLGL